MNNKPKQTKDTSLTRKEIPDYQVGMEIFLEEEKSWESMRQAVCSGALPSPEWMTVYEMDNLFCEGRYKEFKKKLIAIHSGKA